MKLRKRAASLLLSGALLTTLLPPVQAQATGIGTGSGTTGNGDKVGTISATLRLDYYQSQAVLKARNLQVELLQSGQVLGTLTKLFDEDPTESGKLSNSATVTVRNQDGGTPVGDWPGSVYLEIQNLPLGTYQLRFTGTGYHTYTTGDLMLSEYSKHVIVGTGDTTFTLGDVDGDHNVDNKDRDLMSKALETSSTDLATYDLNGDGKIDVIDLAYITRNIKAEGNETLINTAQIDPPVKLDDTNLKNAVVSGTLSSLFKPNGETVSLKTGVDIPIELTNAAEMNAVQIRVPEDQTSLDGSMLVEYEDGSTEPLNIGGTAPTRDVHALNNQVITIQLGKRVPVKKITITVNKTASGDYATVESIQFLKDIVPENPVAPNSEIRNLTATPGNEQVDLSWTRLPNVSGYRVDYYMSKLYKGSDSSGDSDTEIDDSQYVPVEKPEYKQLTVNTNQAQVTGLENLNVYTFTVTPIDGSWSGKTSDPVEAIPEPASVPKPPDMVTLGIRDGGLSVSWKKAENATYYEVFYQVKDSGSNWTQVGNQFKETSTTIDNLVNGTTYSVYIIAGNEIGKSGPSRIAEGTPEATNYDRPEGIPTEGLLPVSKIKSVQLAAPTNYDSASYTEDKPFDIKNVIDGDFQTHWTASSHWNWDEHIICEFTEPVSLTTAIWAPRMDGSYPAYIRAYSVRVWYADDPNGEGVQLVPDPNTGTSDAPGAAHNWPNVPNYSSRVTDRFVIVPLDVQKDVVKISVAVEQDGYNKVSCSELMFMEYDPAHCLPEEISALFNDTLRTTLKPEVTADTIAALETRLNSNEKNYYLYPNIMTDELALAKELLQTNTSSGVLINGIESRAENSQFGQSSSVLQPLGVAAAGSANGKSPSQITIYADGIPSGGQVNVVATQFNTEVNAWRANVGTLSNGRNILTIPKIGSQNTPRGGSLYITYSGANPEQIKLHIRRAVDIPMLNLSNWYSMSESERSSAINAYTTELANYTSKLNTANATTDWNNVTEIAMPSVLLSLPALAVKNGLGNGDAVTQLTNSVRAWEDLMHICKYTQGIGEGTYIASEGTYQHNDMQSRQNIRCMQMFGNAFMYAAVSHVGIGYGSSAGMVGGQPAANLGENATNNNIFGWGIGHEIGHNMDKLGKAEITNNIYAIMAQTYDGKDNTLTSRLEASNKYSKAFQKTAQGYPGASGDVFTQLCMYWQLHLAYDEGGNTQNSPNSMSFYHNFFQAWKAGTYTNGAESYDDRVALTASAIADRDLTEFFTRWGMVLSDSTKSTLAGYPEEPRAIWYLNDQSRRERLNGTTAASGTIEINAEKKSGSDTEVDLTIAPTLSGKIQGYEILRKDNKEFQSIDFVIDDGTSSYTYTDVIGSANHRTYSYQVKVYDILGNEVTDSTSNEIRIAYDMTVDPSSYTMERSGDTTTFTLTESTPVTGLKVINAPESGTFTITVEDADSNNAEQTVRSGDFSQNNLAVDDPTSYLTYFQKPGAAADDTRIWTYHTQKVVVTGIPDTVSDTNIQLIQYAGDDVSFLDSEYGTVGTLMSDYTYSTGDDGGTETIPAGTLVIAGNYRGDPVWQTVKIQGRFTETSIDENGEAVEEEIAERDLDGYALLFAEEPPDGEATDISNGFFLFVPDVQKEKELQGVDSGSDCHAANLLPSEIRAVLSRTDDPYSADSQRITATTLWIHSPGGTDLPQIDLQSDLTNN